MLDEPYEGKPQKVIDNKDFWEDAEHYIIYNEGNKDGKAKG